MSVNPLTEKLRPYVKELLVDANKGSKQAQQVISLYRMHCLCPSDPGAPALCEAAFDEWLKGQAYRKKTQI